MQHYYYNCSKEYINRINSNLYDEVVTSIDSMPKHETQSDINRYLFKQLTDIGWSYDAIPPGVENKPSSNNRYLCLTSSTLQANWHSDFAKEFSGGLVQVEVQFGKVESMFKDFCGFKIAYAERRLKLGIEIVMSQPYEYFAHRKSSVSGMAYFNIAKETLPIIGLECPIWLIGIV
ncbi:MAG: hypothetical protein ABRQ23_00130 [Syntrophomonadaceae bacterium]